jgi:hypothetical protein
MPLIHPATVTSPQHSVANVNVIWDGKAWTAGDPWSGWSVCRLTWEGNPAVGVRWNGNAGDPRDVGYPNRFRYPTWLILPSPIGDAVVACAAEHAASQKAAA